LFRLSLGLDLSANRRWQSVEGDPLGRLFIVLLVGFSAIAPGVAALEALLAVPVAAPAALRPLAAFGLGVGLRVDQLGPVVTLGFLVATAALILETRPALAQHAEIMVRILQIIFGLHAVAAELRVTRQTLVLLEQLGGIAALAIILPITAASRHSLWTLPTAATTTAALTIIDQAICFLIALAPFPSAAKPFASKVHFPRAQAAGAKTLAAPVLTYAPILGAWADGVGGGDGGALRSICSGSVPEQRCSICSAIFQAIFAFT
jgi:hypothetical protein